LYILIDLLDCIRGIFFFNYVYMCVDFMKALIIVCMGSHEHMLLVSIVTLKLGIYRYMLYMAEIGTK